MKFVLKMKYTVAQHGGSLRPHPARCLVGLPSA